jgi:succinate dehydrogenase/fumarate reductase cytochrome b subunit
MGLGVVLIAYFVVLTVIALLGALGIGGLAYLLTRKSKFWKRMVLASVLFPFLCEAFAGGWFIAYAFINYEVFKRDPMLGDTWQTPLPNGYALMMIDTTNPATAQSSEEMTRYSG